MKKENQDPANAQLKEQINQSHLAIVSAFDKSEILATLKSFLYVQQMTDTECTLEVKETFKFNYLMYRMAELAELYYATGKDTDNTE